MALINILTQTYQYCVKWYLLPIYLEKMFADSDSGLLALSQMTKHCVVSSSIGGQLLHTYPYLSCLYVCPGMPKGPISCPATLKQKWLF